MTRQNLAKVALAVAVAALGAPSVRAGLLVSEFQGNTNPNNISIVSFAPNTLTFVIQPPTTTTNPYTDPNGIMNVANGGFVPSTNIHAGGADGTWSVHISHYGPITTDMLGNRFQTITFDATSSDAFPFLQMNIANGVGGAFAQMHLVSISAVVEDAANGEHFFNEVNSITLAGQVGSPTLYDFSPFLLGGSGTYQLTNPSAGAGSLIAFVDSTQTGGNGTYSLLSNAYTETANMVPEPMTLTLLCVGVPLCLVASRRKRVLA